MKTPYFVIESKQLKENYHSFYDKCKKFFPNFKIAYSVKTNSLKEILKILNQESCDFEIASLDEIKLVEKFNKFLVFNGPCKTDEELKKALSLNSLINIDSLQEIDKISELKGKEIGIRVNFSENKFGVFYKDIKKTIKYAEEKGLKVISLSSHPGTQTTFEKYKEYIIKWQELLETLNIQLKYLDIGGGFPDKNQLKNLNVTLEDYFKLLKLPKKFDCLILEPGRCIVADAMFLITKVNYIKKIQDKQYAILDAGINLLPKIVLSSYQFEKLSRDNEKKEEYILAGPLLFSNDVLGKFCGFLKQNDLIKIKNVGAYCYTLSWEISYKKPKVFLDSITQS